MSSLSIKPYFPFCRVRITRQSVSNQGDLAWIVAEPDARFHPICHVCGTLSSGVHSTTHRALQDLNMGAATVSDQLQVPQGSLSSLSGYSRGGSEISFNRTNGSPNGWPNAFTTCAKS